MGKRTTFTDADYSQLRQRLLSYISRPEYEPRKARKLLRDAKIEEEKRGWAQDVLDDLVREGVLVHLKHKGVARAQEVDLFGGFISFIRSGGAFVNSADGKQSVFIPPGESGTALPGDRVLVRINRKHKPSGDQSVEGTVIRVDDRRCRHIVGTLNKRGRVFNVTPMLTSIQKDVIVPDAHGASIGDRVLVKLDDWVDPTLPPEGIIVEALGDADNPQLDTLAVMKAYSLNDQFPADVMREAEVADFSERDYEGREDLRDSFIFTIDPSSARDFDDAISLKPLGGGKVELGVHIADVAHFVREGSALDREARTRGTSTYFPDKVIPMLPIQLSNGLCSLNPKKDRLAFSIFMIIRKNGSLESARFANSVIHSKLRMSYHQALTAINSGNGAAFPEWDMDAEVVDLIKSADRLARKIRQRRLKNGALHIDLPQSEIKIGKDGRISSIDPVVHDPAHQLIEEFMIIANEAVSRELSDRSQPQIFRIHEEPDPEKIAELEAMFIEEGINPGDLTDQKHLSSMMLEIEGKPRSHVWYMRVLRSLKRAVYSTEPVGHFGLAKEYYCHFTSPIRRYPDLIMHRLMKALLLNDKLPYNKRELAQMSLQCSELEQNSIEAEREVIEQKKVRYFSEQLESGNLKEFDALVTEVRNYGMTIELQQAQTFGMIHLSNLTDDFFDYDPKRNELRGRRTKATYTVGSRLKVVIVRVDARKRFLDFAPAGMAPNGNSKPAKIKGSRVNVSGAAKGKGGGKGRGKGKSSGKGKGKSAQSRSGNRKTASSGRGRGKSRRK